jgi:hypothetical protein
VIDERRLAFVAELSARKGFSLKFEERIGAAGLTRIACMSGPRKAAGRSTNDRRERYERDYRTAASGREATASGASQESFSAAQHSTRRTRVKRKLRGRGQARPQRLLARKRSRRR